MEEALSISVGKYLIQTKKYLVTAESCTGGLLSSLITDIPGSSNYFIGGVSTYSYEAKQKLLSVNAATLEKYGAVSAETVKEMAIGVRNLFSGSITLEDIIGLSISGIAGPGGGMPGKPVGLVWFGLSTDRGSWAVKRIWEGNRLENKQFSANFALELLLNYLQGKLPNQYPIGS